MSVKYTIYEEIDEFKSLIDRLKTIIKQLESLEVKYRNKIATQVRHKC